MARKKLAPCRTRILAISELSPHRDDVFIFDFDGVIASRMEDDIYKLRPLSSEVDIIREGAKHFQINCAGMDARYQRHLVYQAAAWSLELPIEPGPGLTVASKVGRTSALFMLTARSGWFAVERMRTFVLQSRLNPVEIFNVGRIKKDRQIALICREFSDRLVWFVEDSIAHLEDARAQSLDNLRLVLARDEMSDPLGETGLRRHFRETVRLAIGGQRKAAQSP